MAYVYLCKVKSVDADGVAEVEGDFLKATKVQPLSVQSEVKQGDEVLVFAADEDDFHEKLYYYPVNKQLRSNKITLFVGNAKIEYENNSMKITVGGQRVELSGSEIKLVGTVVMNGVAQADPQGGPFNAIPNCLFTGAPHGARRVTTS